MHLRVLLAAGAIAAIAAPVAHAQSWSRVTRPGASIDQVSPVRTPDGVLHVAWRERSGPNSENLNHTVIAPNGRVGATTPIQTGWVGILDPAIVFAGGQLRAFWGGFRTTDSSDPNQDLNTASSADGGATWALQPGSIIPGGAQAYGSDIAATALPDGTTLQAWAGTLGTWVHSGLSPSTPNTDYQGSIGQYGNFPGIASNARGAAVMAWFSSAEANRGVLAQAVAPDGTPASAVARLPGSQVMAQGGTVSRTPIVARATGGEFFASYGVGSPPAQVRLWRVGSPGAALIARATGSIETALAADPNGRIWITWSDGTFGSKRVLAKRSNRAATRFGATVNAGVLRGAHSVYALDASATAGALDILANFGTGTATEAATFTERVLPGLTLAASVSSLGRRPRSVTFTVTDAGDPVSGATVRARGRSGRTASNGRVTLSGLNGSATARATKSGYVAATKRLR